MKKLRSVNTRFWDDTFISELTPTSKLLFLYLLTNPLTNVLGIYEIQLKRISFDTGIGLETVKKTLKDFETLKKVFYVDGFIVLSNFIKNQSMNTNMKTGAIKSFNELPNELKDKILDKDLEDFESLLNALKAFENSNSNSNSNIEDEDENENENTNIIKSKKEIGHMTYHMFGHMTEHMEDENENTNIIKSKKEKEIVLPFTSDSFKEVWKLWMKFRAENKWIKYKKIGMQAALNKLSEISNGNEQEAIKIINNSIANSYRGFFEIKESKNKDGFTETNKILRQIEEHNASKTAK